MIKVGYLVPFLVIKALPDYDSYFCNILGTELYSMLPKKYSIKEYKVGDRDWAAVFEIRPPRVILSQKSPQYIRKMIESRFSNILLSNGLKIKKVAKIYSADFYKVAVGCENGLVSSKEIFELFKPHVDSLRENIREKIYFIVYSDNVKEYAVNALYPAPIERVKKVIFYSEMNTVDVKVDTSDVAMFMGKRRLNLLTAIKLTGVNIEINGI